MASTFRSKKRKPSFFKSHQIQDNEGWTHVVSGNPSNLDKMLGRRNFTTTTLDPEEIEASLKRHVHWWSESPTFKQMKDVMEKRILKLDGLAIDRCVCLGLGSITTYLSTATECSISDSGRPLLQLIVLESLIEMLKTKFTIPRVIFQDPGFEASDLTFLASRGYEVLDVPMGDALITPSTFLFAPFVDCVVLPPVLRRVRPTLAMFSSLPERFPDPYQKYFPRLEPVHMSSCH